MISIVRCLTRRAPGFRAMHSARIPMRSARPYLQIPPRRPTNHVFTRLEHTSTSTQAEAIDRLAERIRLAEVSLGNWRFGTKVVVFVGVLIGIVPARNYFEVVRRVDLLYTTMQPQVEETERLQKIAEAQMTIDECVREQQKAQKTIDVYAKELQQLMKENERK
jgi:hypothetical protein